MLIIIPRCNSWVGIKTFVPVGKKLMIMNVCSWYYWALKLTNLFGHGILQTHLYFFMKSSPIIPSPVIGKWSYILIDLLLNWYSYFLLIKNAWIGIDFWSLTVGSCIRGLAGFPSEYFERYFHYFGYNAGFGYPSSSLHLYYYSCYRSVLYFLH